MEDGTLFDMPVRWPNRHEVVDGVVPDSEVPQDPDLFGDDVDDLDAEMED